MEKRKSTFLNLVIISLIDEVASKYVKMSE